MNIDVAFVPAEARLWPSIVCVVIDELRASSTITTLLDLGCTDLSLTASLQGGAPPGEGAREPSRR